MDDKYVKYLTEKIYSSRKEDNLELAERELRLFFNELVQRKRDDPFEGGLQASMVVLSDSFAAKVAEDDGHGLHSCAVINLIKYLKGEDKFYSQKAMRFPTLYLEQRNILSEEGVEIRILDGSENLMLAITSFNNINDYQKEIIKKVISISNDIIDNYQNVEIGIHAPNVIVEFTNLNKESFKNIINSITESNSKIKR